MAFVLALTVGLAVAASEDRPAAPPPGSTTEETQVASDTKPPTAPAIRIGSEALLGGAGLGAGLLAGLVSGAFASGCLFNCDRAELTVYAVTVGVSSAALTSLGVYLAGQWLDGNGQYLWTLAGAAVGVVPLAVSVVVRDMPLLPLWYALPVVGAIVAYELTRSGPVSAAAAQARRQTWAPFAFVAGGRSPTPVVGVVSLF